MVRRLKLAGPLLGMFIRALTEEPHSRAELSELTGLHPLAIGRWVRALHDSKVIHVAGWAQDPKGGYTIALYRFGLDKPDKPQPARLTGAQRWARTKTKREHRQMIQLTAGAIT